MKTKFITIINSLLILLMLVACVKDPAKEEPNGEDPSNPTTEVTDPEDKEPEATDPEETDPEETDPETILPDWGLSMDDVIEIYKSSTKVADDVLKYKKSSSETLAYYFVSDKLAAAILIIDSKEIEADKNKVIEGYSFYVDVDGIEVYDNDDSNTMAYLWPIDESGDASKLIIGFAPIQSDAYPEILPIEVRTGDVVTPGATSVTVEGEVSGIDEEVEVGFIYGTDQALPEDKSIKVVTQSSSSFNLDLTRLSEGTVYYYCAFAVIDDIDYYGEVKSFETLTLVHPVESIKLNRSSLSLTEGETATLTATVKPDNATNKSIEWSSSDTSIASVSEEGVVRAIAPGNAVITATTVDGGLTATCKVSVIVPVTGVSLNISSVEILEEARETLIATVEPANATNQSVTWKTSDETIASVTQNGKVTGNNVGTALITVTTKDGGYTASCNVTIKDNISGTVNGHDYVDLGLSVNWATSNIGASSRMDYGNYYAWGETSAKSNYELTNYRFRKSGSESYNVKLSKYNTSSFYGSIDYRTKLELSDDAARVIWGGTWRMPTKAEFDELISKCSWRWTTKDGKKGYKVTSNINGNSIFLPAAGYIDGSKQYLNGSALAYWSSSLDTDLPLCAWILDYVSSGIRTYGNLRYCGFSVRPVTQ